MTRRRRIVLIAIAALLALPVAGFLVAAIALPSEAVAGRVAGSAEARLGREVRIGDVGVSLFPLGVSLERLAVAGRTPDAPPVVSVESFLLKPRLLPLLRGRMVVDELRLVGARLAVTVDSAGVSNLPDLAPDSAAQPPSGSLAFDVRSIRIERGSISLDDARADRAARVDGIDQTLRVSGDVLAGRLRAIVVAGSITVDSVALRMPGDDDWTTHGVRVALDHDARLLADSGVLHVDSLRVQVQEIVLHGGGTVRGLTATDSVRYLDLRLAAEPFDVARLIESLPARFTEPLRAEDATLSGTAALAATVSGPLSVDTFPDIRGTLSLRDASATRAGHSLLAGLSGDIAFSNDSIGTAGLTGAALGEPLRLSFLLRDPGDPTVSFDVDAAAGLETLRAAGFLADTAPPMRGRVHAVARGVVRPSNADSSRIDGVLTVERFATTTRKGQAVALDAATLAFGGDSIRLAPARLAVAGQEMTVAATITDWMARAFGDSTHLPVVAFEARGGRFDLEPVLGPAPTPTFSQLVFARLANAPIEGRPPEAIATERGAAPPRLPAVRATGAIAFDTLLSAGVAYTDVAARVRSTPEQLVVEQATFGMMGGRGDVAAVLTPRGAARDSTAAAMHVLVQAEMRDLASDQFLTRFTSFRERANGRLDLSGVVELLLDRHMLPERETVQGRGVMTLREGRLVAWPVLRTLGERLGTGAFDTVRLREFAGGFDVAGPMVRFDDAVLASASGNARVAGSFTFDGRLDFGVEARLPASLAARAGSTLAAALSQAADTTGEVPVGLRIGGVWRRPEVTPDLSRARANVVNAAREAATREAERLAEEGARAIADRLGLGAADSAGDTSAARLPSLDSIGDAVESARDSVENRVRNRIRDLF